MSSVFSAPRLRTPEPSGNGPRPGISEQRLLVEGEQLLVLRLLLLAAGLAHRTPRGAGRSVRRGFRSGRSAGRFVDLHDGPIPAARRSLRIGYSCLRSLRGRRRRIIRRYCGRGIGREAPGRRGSFRGNRCGRGRFRRGFGAVVVAHRHDLAVGGLQVLADLDEQGPDPLQPLQQFARAVRRIARLAPSSVMPHSLTRW